MGSCLSRSKPGKGQRLGDASSAPGSSTSSAPGASASASAGRPGTGSSDREARAAAAEARAAAAAKRGTGAGGTGPGSLGRKLAAEQAAGGTSASAKDQNAPERVVWD